MNKVKVGDISLCNVRNVSKKDGLTVIKYLDTSNLTQNRIDELKSLSLKDAPSRAKRKVKKNDILISTVRPNQKHFGFIKEDDEELIVSTGFAVLSPNESLVNPKFLYYFLTQESTTNYLQTIAEGATTSYPSIKPEDITNLEIELPPLEEQQKIANYLSNLDNQIELNNKINKELEEAAQTLYNYWFVQFEFPNEEGNPYKSSGGKMIWNEELKREIPEGWEVKNILQLVNWVGGAQPPKKEHINEYREGYVRFIQNRDYQGDNHITYIKESSSNKLCDKYDIMMDKYGEAGKVRYGIKGAYNVALAKLEMLEHGIQEYIRKFFEDKNTFEYLKNASMASTRASLNSHTLGTLNICLPEKRLLVQFESIGKQVIDMILSNKEQNQELARLRDFMLLLLMNGQVTIED